MSIATQLRYLAILSTTLSQSSDLDGDEPAMAGLDQTG